MMLNLSLTSIKKRWRDYVVLMMGLVIAIAIFYMFQTLSLNTDFLEANIPAVGMVAIVFQLGAFLLSIITIVYIFYANSFLLSMRKKEYGMYMMLGAKKRKIGQMMRIETLFIGSVSMSVGLLLGTFLAKGMGSWLSTSIDLPSDTYKGFVPLALIITVLFFALLFLITSFVNVRKFKKTSTLDLLYSDSQSERPKTKKGLTILKTISSLILIGIGYYFMKNMYTYQIMGVLIAIVTITPGTFLFFSGLLPVLVDQIKSWERLSSQKINTFTLSQLSFKASSLGRVLGLVTMLLALSLGAITVGQAFKNYSTDLLKTSVNDLVIVNQSPEIQEVTTKLETEKDVIYHSKTIDNVSYYIAEELKENPLLFQKERVVGAEFVELDGLELHHNYRFQNEKEQTIAQSFNQLGDGYSAKNDLFQTSYQVLNQREFDQLNGKLDQVRILRVTDYQKQLPVFKAVHQLELERHENSDTYMSSKYVMYQEVQGLSNGFMFMGFFLGFAFLAMLASCLMFKILTGAYQDIVRYQMLHKIGVKRQWLLGSIFKEIFAIFFAPAVVGVIHVLVGLRMFKMFIPNIYSYISWPFFLFGCVYMSYYLMTVYLYKNIVIPKK